MIALSTLALATSLTVAVPPTQQGYQIRLKLAKGQVVRHSVVMKTAVPNQQGKTTNVTISMLVRQLCTKSMPNAFTIESTVEKASMAVPGMDPKLLKNQADAMMKQKTSYVMDSLGKIVGGQTQTSGFNNPTSYPSNPVRVGQSWSSQVNLPSQYGQLQMTVRNKFLGIEKLGKQNCYKISLSMNATGNLTVSGGGTMWVRASDGMPEKGSFTNHMKMASGSQAVAFDVTTSMVRK